MATTLKDYARDLVLATVDKTNKYNSNNVELTEDEIEELLADFLIEVKRLVGDE